MTITGKCHFYIDSFCIRSIKGQLVAMVKVIRPGISPVIKSLLPILFIIFVTLLTLFINEGMIETRLKLNISILIAAVLFHVSIGNFLPPIAYLILVDKLMIFTYLILVATLFNDIVIMRRAKA